MKRFEVVCKIGRRLDGPYSCIYTAADEDGAIKEFGKDWAGFVVFICKVRLVK